MSVSVSVLSPVVAVLGPGSDPVLSPVVAVLGPGSDPVLSPVVAWQGRECPCVKPSGGCVGSRK